MKCLGTVKSRPKKLESMNSLTLKEMGFSEPCPLKTISFANLPLDKSVVFAVIDTSLTGKAPTDIMYIGRSKKPTKRIIGGYIGGYGGKNTKRINSTLLEGGYIEKSSICWKLSDKPKTMQMELLNKFGEAQGKFPAWNASNKKQAKSLSKKAPKTKPKPTATPVAKTIKTRPVARKARAAKPVAPAKMAPPTKPAETTKAPTAPTQGNSTPQPKTAP